MVSVLTMPGCSRCKYVKSFLRDRQVPFEEININLLLLDDKALKNLLYRYDISQIAEDIDESDPQKAAKALQESPSRFRKPALLLNEKDMQDDYLADVLQELQTRDNFKGCPAGCAMYSLCQKSRTNPSAAIASVRERKQRK